MQFETISYAFVPSFISMHATVTKFEEKCLKLFEQYVVVMEKMYYACVPSFTSMRNKFEE